MEKVVSLEFRMNNSSQFTVAHLECGHERTLEYGSRPTQAVCWVCPEPKHEGRLIADLTYISYKHQRKISPDVAPERWALIFDQSADLEARYQAELSEQNSCIAGIGTDATGENGYECGKPVVADGLCADHQ